MEKTRSSELISHVGLGGFTGGRVDVEADADADVDARLLAGVDGVAGFLFGGGDAGNVGDEIESGDTVSVICAYV